MRIRARGQPQPRLDATLSDIIRFQGRVLYGLGGRPLLNRAIVHVGTNVGRHGAEVVLDLFSDFGN